MIAVNGKSLIHNLNVFIQLDLQESYTLEFRQVKINQFLLESDKTKLEIEVYDGNKLIETSGTNFLSPRSFD